jgi:hypothetical protein
MNVMGLSGEAQEQVIKLLAAVLHLGNIDFVEEGAYAKVRDAQFLEFPACVSRFGLNAPTADSFTFRAASCFAFAAREAHGPAAIRSGLAPRPCRRGVHANALLLRTCGRHILAGVTLMRTSC